MSDKFLGFGGIYLESDDDLIGEALGIRVDKYGNLRTVDKPLKNIDLLSEPVEIKSGEWEYFTIHTGAKSFSFLGLTESQHGNVEVAFTNHISGTSMPYSYEKIPISNNRFETDTYVSKSET